MSFKQEILDGFEHSELEDIVNHGCASACPGGYIFYNETSAAYDKHVEEIWDKLDAMYEDCGCKNILELIASFNGAKGVGSDYQFKNLLVWFYIEEIAREEVERKGVNDENP